MRYLENPTQIQQASFHSLRAHPEILIIKQYLESNLSKADSDNRILKEVDLYRSQGKALTLKAILELLEVSKTS